MSQPISEDYNFGVIYPELIKEWSDKNPFSPYEVAPKSNKNVWWKCQKGHEWKTKINNRTRKNPPTPCPYCAGRKVLQGENDILTTHPVSELIWDFSRNTDNPTLLSAGSNKIVWWKCLDKQHTYKRSINKQLNRSGRCPSCYPVSLKQKLSTEKFDYLRKEWHLIANKQSFDESELLGHEKYWWLCSQGHKWKARLQDRIRNHGCPYCNKNTFLQGVNDLETCNPELLTEWDYAKNSVSPSLVHKGSRQKVWWLCECGHEWQATIEQRTRVKTNCPLCARKGGTSIIEQKIRESLREESSITNLNLNHIDKLPEKFNYREIQADMFGLYKNRKFVIEYDGYYWHQSQEKTLRDMAVTAHLLLHGYIVIRIREQHAKTNMAFPLPLDHAHFKQIPYAGNYRDNLDSLKQEILSALETISTNFAKDIPEVIVTEGKTSNLVKYLLGKVFIEQAWSEKIPLRDIILQGDFDTKYTWTCSKNHLWKTTIRSKLLQGSGCPYCAGRAVEGINDLVTTNPELVKEWHDKKNKLIPNMVSKGSSRKVWWKCLEGHEWKTTIYSRAVKHSGCPYCAGKRIEEGFNDLFTVAPKLKNLWSNQNAFDPKLLGKESNKVAWWHCDKGEDHQYESPIHQVVRVRGNCPHCTTFNKRLLKGFNDLGTLYPAIASEWDCNRNTLCPSDVVPHSNLKVYWICHLGHEWKAQIQSRIKDNGCPYCSNKRVLKGFNDLGTTHPNLVPEWSLENSLHFTEITYGSNKKVWWKCPKGHSYSAAISSRAQAKPTGCTVCAGKQVLIGFNDFASCCPDLLADWDFSNNEIHPTELTKSSGKEVNWTCSTCHYNYKGTIHYRLKIQQCPNCAFLSRKVSTQFNESFDLVSQIFPMRKIDLFTWDEWFPTRKRTFLPTLRMFEIKNKKVFLEGVSGWDNDEKVIQRNVRKTLLLLENPTHMVIRLKYKHHPAFPIDNERLRIIELKDSKPFNYAKLSTDIIDAIYTLTREE